MRALLIVSFIYFFVAGYGQDSPVYISGKVFDLENNKALIGANIFFGNQQGTISDFEGNYRLKLPPGKWKISFRYIGYTTKVKVLTVDSGESPVINVGLSPSINEIDQIVVSANKSEQKLSDITVSMTLIKPYSLSNNHITDAQELINKTPGIEVLDGQASIRGGSGFSYGAGSRVMALIDGLPVVSADAGNIKWQFLPLENLSQVEIIKGASSVLYGSSAINGVINFRTAEAGLVPRTKFFLETGMYDSPSNIEWKWWDTPRVFTNASLSHLQKVGNTDIGIAGTMVFDNGYRKFNDEKLGRFSVRLKHYSKKIEGLKYGINLNSGLTYKTDFILWEDALTGALKQSETTATSFYGSLIAIDPYISFSNSVTSNHDLRMRFQATSNHFPDGGNTDSKARSYYSEYQFQKSLSKVLKLNLGLSENYSKVFSNFYGDHENVNVAGFTQLDIVTNKRIKLVAGLRVEQNILDGTADKFVPIFRSGINYRLANYTFLRASFGQGYRYPSIAEKFASTSLGSIKVFPNYEIRPESGWNSEIGIKHGLSMGDITGMVDIAAFYSQNKDMIAYIFGVYPDPVTDSLDFGFKAGNVEDSRVYGVETEFNLNFTSGTVHNIISGGYIFMYPVEYNSYSGNNTGKFLKYRRKHSASLGWMMRIRQFDAGLNFYAKSKILAIDNVFVNDRTREDILPGFYDYWISNNKGYVLSDLSFGYHKSEHLKLSLVIKNLFNVEYMGRPGDIMPHRNISIRFSGIY